tara:strand:- start:1194 stop:1814 length:621 start_codon:yes stop_codon:yes gene_type:complete
MKKDLHRVMQLDILHNSIAKLDRDKIHVLYFSYYLNWYNFYHSPLLLTTKILSWITRKPYIDHIAHISRFVFDKEFNRYNPKIFEATIDRGMEQNDLISKLKRMQGICYIETVGYVNKGKARNFEASYNGVPYRKKLAAMSGIDIIFKPSKASDKNNGGFCSWLESLFLIDQGIDLSHIEKGNPLEMTPADIYSSNLGSKTILFKF